MIISAYNQQICEIKESAEAYLIPKNTQQEKTTNPEWKGLKKKRRKRLISERE